MITLEDQLKNICSRSTHYRGSKPWPALMTHVVVGYPSLPKTIEIAMTMADAGASLIELQIPFSDPMADGPTIMRANEHALAGGTTPKDCMRVMETLSARVDVPLLFMSYFNLIHAYGNQRGKSGLARFLADARSAGAQGMIVPDIPPEESHEGYWTLTYKNGLAAIPLVSPVSSETRLKKIAAASKSGFVYCVSTTGTTGARKELPQDLRAYLQRIRRHFSQPLAVGFGISKREHIQILSGSAEIAIVGSAVINIIEKSSAKSAAANVRKFVRQLTRNS